MKHPGAQEEHPGWRWRWVHQKGSKNLRWKFWMQWKCFTFESLEPQRRWCTYWQTDTISACNLRVQMRERGRDREGRSSDADAAPRKGGSAYITVQQLLTASLSLCSDRGLLRNIWIHSLGCRPANACRGPRTRRGQQTKTKSGGWEYLWEREREGERDEKREEKQPHYSVVAPLLPSGQPAPCPAQRFPMSQLKKKSAQKAHMHVVLGQSV